jgi:magnesium-transporting ATPase (P-type)
LWIAAALAFFAEWREPGQGMATLGFAIVGVIVINGVFSFWQAYRAAECFHGGQMANQCVAFRHPLRAHRERFYAFEI